MRFLESLVNFLSAVLWFSAIHLWLLWIAHEGNIDSVVTIANIKYIYCDIVDCCEGNTNNYYKMVPTMKQMFHDKLHGQNMATDKIVRIIEDRYYNIDKGQSLTIELYGPPGTGKSYTTQLIVESILSKGMRTPLYHVFDGQNMNFLEEDLITYKDNIKDWLVGNLTKCKRSMFIFKHTENIPPKILDVIEEVLCTNMGGIFLFTTTERDQMIAKIYSYLLKRGMKKKYMGSTSFQQVVKDSLFNIEDRVIFLPMELEDLRNCMYDEFERLGRLSPPDCMTEKVIEFIKVNRFPNKYVTCKDIVKLTRYIMEHESC